MESLAGRAFDARTFPQTHSHSSSSSAENENKPLLQIQVVLYILVVHFVDVYQRSVGRSVMFLCTAFDGAYVYVRAMSILRMPCRVHMHSLDGKFKVEQTSTAYINIYR